MTTQLQNVSPEAEVLAGNLVSLAQNNSPTPASIVLSNSDLIESILPFFDSNAFHKNIWDLKSPTRKCLFNVALTSRALYGPAVRYLWRMMESLTPLLKILPNFTRTSDRAAFTISGPLTADSISRLRSYAANVWYLRLRPGKDMISSHTLFRLLSLNKPVVSLFPSLKMVLASMPTGFSFQEPDFQNLNGLFLAMAAPTLSTLSFSDITSNSEDFTTSLLAAASVDSPEVKRIILRGHFTTKSLDLLPQFRELRTIHLSGSSTVIPAAAFLALDQLKTIIFALDDSTFDLTGHPIAHDGTNFNALEHLELNGSSVEIAKILGILKPQQTTSPLETIKLTFPSYWNTGGSNTEGITACIRECGRISPSSMRCLQLSGGRGHTLGRGSLEPLVNCTRLETLDIRDITLELVDEDIEAICRKERWSSLRSLRLPTSPDGQAPSLFSIRTITEACPNLHTLFMCTDFRLREHEALQDAVSDNHTNNHLQTLSILEVAAVDRGVTMPSNMMLAIAVSRYLEHHFRRLVALEYSASRGSEWWAGVRTMMVQYRDIRAEMLSATLRQPETV